MLLHMSNNLVDSIQYAYIATLRRNSLHQPLRWQGSDDRPSLGHSTRKCLHQLSPTQPTIRTELGISNPHVLRPTDPMYRPLPHVPAEMEHQISYCIFMRSMPFPDLRIRQLSQTNTQVICHPIQLLARIVQKQSSDLVIHDAILALTH